MPSASHGREALNAVTRTVDGEVSLPVHPAWLDDWYECLNDIEKAGIRYREIDGRAFVAVVPFLFTAAIIVGNSWDDGCYEDRWCFKNLGMANEAFDRWDGAGEPSGWHRHPMTGRCREDGDPAREYVSR